MYPSRPGKPGTPVIPYGIIIKTVGGGWYCSTGTGSPPPNTAWNITLCTISLLFNNQAHGGFNPLWLCHLHTTNWNPTAIITMTLKQTNISTNQISLLFVRIIHFGFAFYFAKNSGGMILWTIPRAKKWRIYISPIPRDLHPWIKRSEEKPIFNGLQMCIRIMITNWSLFRFIWLSPPLWNLFYS